MGSDIADLVGMLAVASDLRAVPWHVVQASAGRMEEILTEVLGQECPTYNNLQQPTNYGR